MSVRLQMDGLAEFRRALRALPEDLRTDANDIVLSHADQAKTQIQTNYPDGRTGNLRRGVTLERNTSKFGSEAIVRSRAKHAHLFEFGTKARHDRRGRGRGVMPKAPESQAMLPVVIRVRARMVRALIDLVQRAGFTVGA